MKKSLLFIFTALYSLLAFSQANVVFYHENNRPFTLIIDGIAQNVSPKSNIKVTDINMSMMDVEIQFNNGKIAHRMVMSTQGMEITYKIKRNPDTGLPFIYFDRETSISKVTYRNQFVIQYQVPVQVHDDNSHHEDVTNSGVILNNHNYNDKNHDHHHNNNTNDEVIIIDDRCLAMDKVSFEQAKQAIKRKPFASSKMTTAKQILDHNCLNVAQVKQIALLFTFEDDKLEFVKAAYPQTVNQHKFYLVNDIFTFSRSIENLDKYIKAQRR